MARRKVVSTSRRVAWSADTSAASSGPRSPSARAALSRTSGKMRTPVPGCRSTTSDASSRASRDIPVAMSARMRAA